MCDDFESDTAGMAPDATRWHLITGSTAGSPNTVPSGGLRISIDGSQHHSGTHSLRVAGGDSNGWYASNTSAFPKIQGTQIYVRFYAQFSGDPSSSGKAATQDHNGFLSMWSGPAATAADPSFFSKYYSLTSDGTGELRVGFQSGIMDWNATLTVGTTKLDDTLPDLSPTGIAQSVSPKANTWDCYEFHIDETNNHCEFWFNSTLVPGLSWDGTDVASVSDQWTKMPVPPLSIQSLGLGWLQLGNSETAWYDDVIVSSQRIRCQ